MFDWAAVVGIRDHREDYGHSNDAGDEIETVSGMKVFKSAVGVVH